MTNPNDDLTNLPRFWGKPEHLKNRLQTHFAERAHDHPAILTELHARQAERKIQLSVDHFVLVCRLKMLWGWHIEVAPRKPYTQPLGVKEYYHLYTGGKRVVNHHGYPLIFGSLLEALTYDPVWATVEEALALVPEGCDLVMMRHSDRPDAERFAAHFVAMPENRPYYDVGNASASTPAAAILAARLDWEERKA